VAEVLARDPAREVEHLVAVGVPERRALGARDDESVVATPRGTNRSRASPHVRRAVQLLRRHGEAYSCEERAAVRRPLHVR
jgi:hypothetical protein